MNKLRRRIAMGAVLVALASLPLGVRAAPGTVPKLTVNNACARGVCCLQIGSVCSLGGDQFLNHKYYAGGSCPGV